MELWFSEKHTDSVKLSIKADKHIYSGKSAFQRIDIFESHEFGRVLVLDGVTMLTEKDEFVYHEMLTHVPMAVNPDAKRVLVIGAGDGGIVRELAKYPSIKKIDMVEIDKMVVEVSKKFLPTVSSALSDPRLDIYYQDGLKYIRKHDTAYDLIIVDSTDPFGPGEGLFTKEFYGSCSKALTDDGIMVNQLGSPFYTDDAEATKRAYRKIRESFPILAAYQAHIPTYPSGLWLFGFASKKLQPCVLKCSTWNIPTKYYNPQLHVGAFALPTYVRQTLESVCQCGMWN